MTQKIDAIDEWRAVPFEQVGREEPASARNMGAAKIRHVVSRSMAQYATLFGATVTRLAGLVHVIADPRKAQETEMKAGEFESQLAKAGFQDIETRAMEPRPANEDHTHDFTIRGLVTAGEFIVTCEGQRQRYATGDIFEVAAGKPHNEAVGADGASIIFGKLYS